MNRFEMTEQTQHDDFDEDREIATRVAASKSWAELMALISAIDDEVDVSCPVDGNYREPAPQYTRPEPLSMNPIAYRATMKLPHYPRGMSMQQALRMPDPAKTIGRFESFYEAADVDSFAEAVATEFGFPSHMSFHDMCNSFNVE